jgi:hypothetical protein
MGFGRPLLCFYLTVWFQRERCEALLAVTIMRHGSRSMVKSASGECHGSQDLRTGNGGSSLWRGGIGLVIRDTEQRHQKRG